MSVGTDRSRGRRLVPAVAVRASGSLFCERIDAGVAASKRPEDDGTVQHLAKLAGGRDETWQASFNQGQGSGALGICPKTELRDGDGCASERPPTTVPGH